jgi:hypothetical protein
MKHTADHEAHVSSRASELAEITATELRRRRSLEAFAGYARLLPPEERERFRRFWENPAAYALEAAGLKDTPELREQYRKGNFKQP